MATKNTRTSSTKKKSKSSSASRRTTSGKRRRSKKQSRIYRENAIFITISLISLLLMVSILGHGGRFGEIARELQFGFSGLLAYVFPILLFALSVYLYVGRKKVNKYARAFVYVILFVFICFFFQLATGNYAGGGTGLQAAAYSKQTHMGGGLIGGSLEGIIRSVFGLIGAYLIDIAVIIFCIVYLTGKSFVAGVGKGTAKAYNKAYTKTKENIEYQKEQRSRKKEEESKLRMNHKVSGVSYDTKVEHAADKGEKTSAGRKSSKKQTIETIPESSYGRQTPSFTKANRSILENDYKASAYRERKRQTAESIEPIESREDVTPASIYREMTAAAQENAASDQSYGRSLNDRSSDRTASAFDYEAPSAFAEDERDNTDPWMQGGYEADETSFTDERKVPFEQFEQDAYDGKNTSLSSSAYEEEEQSWLDEDPSIPNESELEFEDEEEDEEAEDPRAILEELARPVAKTTALAAGGAAVYAAAEARKSSGSEREAASSEDRKKEAAKTVKTEEAKAEEKLEISDSIPELEEYSFPSIELLARPAAPAGGRDAFAYQNQQKLQDTMQSFGVNVTVTGFQQGPTVTRYELLPAAGVKVSKILSLSDDLKLALAAPDIRIEAPIPGKSAIGIEVPNKTRVTVSLRELIDTEAFETHKSKIAFAAGKDINGNVILADIQKMPHLLIAGATGSGKSVCINTIIMSILYKARPDEVKLIMIDPKVVELSIYNGIPHLLTPVVTDPKKAASALNWAVAEMTRRYQLFASESVRDIKAYNAKARKANADKEMVAEILPQIVIIVDELADLMMVAPSEVEDAICRLAQLARAAGLHLVIATQRPSVNVITGLIKANMPSRIAFSVSSGVDSRTILDMNGAEKLLGNGDMLYYPQGLSKPLRVQGAFVSDDEVSAVVEAVKENNEKPEYNEEISTHEISSSGTSASSGDTEEERDELFEQAGRFLIEANKGSIGSLQRKFRIGFNRAARIVDQLEEAGVLGPEEGTKPRQILMTIEEFESLGTEKGEGEEET